MTAPATYVISGLASLQDIAEFGQLLEFARAGKVVCGWRDPDGDERDRDQDDGYCEPAPVYDDTDRSPHPRFALAQALDRAGCYDTFIRDTATPPVLVAHLPGRHGELLAAGELTGGLTVAPADCDRAASLA